MSLFSRSVAVERLEVAVSESTATLSLISTLYIYICSLLLFLISLVYLPVLETPCITLPLNGFLLTYSSKDENN